MVCGASWIAGILVLVALQVSNVQVGKMDIVWRSRFGERGRIQTGQLKATVSPAAVLSLCILSTTLLLPLSFSGSSSA